MEGVLVLHHPGLKLGLGEACLYFLVPINFQEEKHEINNNMKHNIKLAGIEFTFFPGKFDHIQHRQPLGLQM